MSPRELEKRCKLEYLERVSHLKYLEESSKGKLRDFGDKLCNKFTVTSLKNVMNYMRFHSRRRATLTKKYFTLWVILKYEDSLQAINHEIVNEQYLAEESRRALLKKCFGGWKQLMIRNY